MIDTNEEAIRGDKAARDLMLSEKKYIIGANRAGKSTFFTNIQNFFEIQKKEIEKLQTELIKERAVNAKMKNALEQLSMHASVAFADDDAVMTSWVRVVDLANSVLKQAEKL